MGRRKRLCGAILILGLMLPAVVMGPDSGAYAAAGTWKHDSKGWWYAYSGGSYAKNEWVKSGGKWYYFKANGYMATGWVKSGNKWYYCAKSGAMVTGWKKIDGKWYFFDDNGAAVRGFTNADDGAWYYLGKDYAMKTGWVKVDKEWYFFNSKGAMVFGWMKRGGKVYYFDGNGCMVTGEQDIDGVTYTFGDDGALTADNDGGFLKGSWSEPLAAKLTDSLKGMFTAAIGDSEYDLGSCILMADLGAQTEEETDQMFLCRMTGDDDTGRYAIITIHEGMVGEEMMRTVKSVLICAEEVPGGYNDAASIFLDSNYVVVSEALKAFDEASKDMPDVNYRPAAVLSSKTSYGTDYRLLCCVKEGIPEKEGFFAVVTVNVPSSGKPQITGITPFSE